MALTSKLCAFLYLLAALVAPARAYEAQGFIRVCNGKFADSKGKQIFFAGWNGYTNMLNDAYDYLYNGKPDKVTARMRAANAAGLNLARMWGHGEGSRILQTGPGIYDPRVFRAMDYVVAQAHKHNIKLLVSVTTFWQDADGILAYARWAGLTYAMKQQTPYYTEQWGAKDAFWLSRKAQQLYMNNLKNMFNRKNSFNGLLYKNDPAIMGWGIFNEMRCPASQMTAGCVGRLRNWVNSMTQYGKSINKNQLFTVGMEGFFANQPQCNPSGIPGNVQAGWAAKTGQDFPTQHQYSDFMEFHLWPYNWNTFGTSFVNTWLQCHADACKKAKKPCLLGEFGRALYGGDANPSGVARIRDPYFRAVYGKTQSLVNSGQSLAGTLFWEWTNQDAGGGSTGNSVRSSDSTFSKVIKPHARFMSAKSGRQICSAHRG